MLEATIVSTPEEFTDGIPISTIKSTPVKKARVKKKLLPVELEILNLIARQLHMELHHGH